MKWGVPKRYADFEKLISHALEGTPQGAQFLSCHQGEWEAEIAETAYAKLKVSVQKSVYPVSELQAFWPHPYDICIFSSTSCSE